MNQWLKKQHLEGPTKQCNVHLSMSDMRTLKRIAAAQDITMATLVRNALAPILSKADELLVVPEGK